MNADKAGFRRSEKKNSITSQSLGTQAEKTFSSSKFKSEH